MTLDHALAHKTFTFGSCLAVAGFLAAIAPPAASAGTVTLLSQERRISAVVDYQAVNPQPADSQEKSATGFGVFDDSVTAHTTNADASATVTTSVNSRLGQDGFFFKGVMSWELSKESQSGGIANAITQTDFRVDFAIDEPYHYDFRTDNKLTGTDPNSGEGDFRIEGTNLTLTPSDGILQPGQYSLKLTESLGRLGGPASTKVDYDYALELSPVSSGGGDNGGGTPAVPLPPAVWSGAIVLAAGALNRLRKRLA